MALLTPIPEERIIEAADGHEIDFHGRLLRFIDTPGHALHHFCIVDSLSKGIFTGDTFGLSYRQFDSPDTTGDSTGDTRTVLVCNYYTNTL